MSDLSTTVIPPLAEAPETSNPPLIQSEEQFRAEVEEIHQVKKRNFSSDMFDELARHVHDSLKAQDSDRALTLITK